MTSAVEYMKACEKCKHCVMKFCVPYVCSLTGEVIGNFVAEKCKYYNKDKGKHIPKAYLNE